MSEDAKLHFNSGFGGIHWNLTKAQIYCFPRYRRGIAMVLRFQLGCYPLAPELLEWKILSCYFWNKYPFCKRDGPGTGHHLFFECLAWRRARTRSRLDEVIEAVNALLEKRRQAPLTTLLAEVDSSDTFLFL